MLAASIVKNMALLELSLGSAFDDKQLFFLLHDHSSILSLSGNDVGDTGAKSWAGALQSNQVLRELYLHGT